MSDPDWAGATRLLLALPQLSAAHAVLATATRAFPDDARPWIALAELAALADDYPAARQAIQQAAQRKPATLPACLTDDADVALRLAQLWVSVDGPHRPSRFWLTRCLERFAWFVPPVPSGYSAQSYAAAVAPTLARLAAAPRHPAEALSFWTHWLDPSDGPELRGEVLLSQAGAHRPAHWGAARLLERQRLTRDAARAEDALGLLPLFADDGAFGALRFRLEDGDVVSRDQINSAVELNWLAARLGLTRGSTPLLVDIGAGYGRLAHRFLQAFPAARALALDAVPGTTAMAELYLTARGCAGRVETAGPSRLLAPLPPGAPRIATNINSWSEAPLASIRAWLELLAGADIDWLLLATHDATAVTLECDGPGQPMLPAILEAGWILDDDRPRFAAEAGWGCRMWLFRRG